MTVLFQPVDIQRAEPYDDSARQRIIAELRVEFGKHPSPSTLPPDDPRYIEWAAALVLLSQKVERRTLALMSHDGKEIAFTQSEVVLAADGVEVAIQDEIQTLTRARR